MTEHQHCEEVDGGIIYRCQCGKKLCFKSIPDVDPQCCGKGMVRIR